ncbi:hypothetical protein GGR51DRAFT_565744 [Nemania sp. FL0031]|nr:hypothetical protein GGR51DRAFT_565744 [Nemania sp. FL0031]
MSDRSICVHQNAALLAEAAGCGDRIPLQKCLLDAPNFVTLEDIQRCFIDADCTIADAASEANTIVKNCDASSSVPEMRRRSPQAPPAETSAPQTSNTAPESTSPATSTSTHLTAPTVCSTTSTLERLVCPVTPVGPNKFSELPCTSTKIATLVCAATNVCSDDGNCMFRDAHVTSSGLAATIVLALAAFSVAATLVFFYARERKARRLAFEEAERKRREQDQKDAEASLKKFAKVRAARERSRRQNMEARDWAYRRAMETRREENPFEEAPGGTP